MFMHSVNFAQCLALMNAHFVLIIFFKASFSSGIDYNRLDQEDSGNVGV